MKYVLLGKNSSGYPIQPPPEMPLAVRDQPFEGFVAMSDSELAARVSEHAKAAEVWSGELEALASADEQSHEYKRLRAARYDAEASTFDLADAEAKLASLNPKIQAEGAAQKAAVLAKRLNIKAEIPKPEQP